MAKYHRSPAQRSTGTTADTPSIDGLLTRSARDSLVSSFLQKCRPWMPLVSAAQVRQLFASKNEPNLVMLAILVAGSKTSSAPQAQELGQKCYEAAKQRFYTGCETDTLDVITSTIILQWWNQTGPEHVSVDNSSLWLRLGVALAHQCGLHRQPDARSPQYARRRKLWWTLVSRDNQIATSHGRPRAIHPEDCDVRSLRLDDFDDDDNDALLFINFVSITSILGDLTQACLRGELTHRRRADVEDRLLTWLRELPPQLHLHDRGSHQLIPYSFYGRQIHVPFFVSFIILFRQKTPERCPPAISLLASSFITGIFEEYLDWGDIAFVSPASIFYLLVASLVQASSHRFSPFSLHQEKERRITHLALQELKKRFHTAVGAERIVKSMERVSSQAETTDVPLGLDPQQQELLAFFGRDLCLQWDNVLQAITTKKNGRTGPPVQNANNIEQPSEQLFDPNEMAPPMNNLPASLVNDAFGQDDWIGDPLLDPYAEEPMYGQWWWSDMWPTV